MAIIPRGNFKNRGTASGSISLPNDGAAKPYQALTQLGGQISQIGLNMYVKTKRNRQINDVNKALDIYSQNNARVKDELDTQINDSGMVSDKETYSQSYEQLDTNSLERISGELPDKETADLFKQKVAGASRSNRTGAIFFENQHITKMEGINIPKANISAAQEYALGETFIPEQGHDAWRKREVEITSKMSETGTLSPEQAAKFSDHNGVTQANTIAETIVHITDPVGFLQFFGVKNIRSREIRDFIEAEDLRDPFEKMSEARQRMAKELVSNDKKYSTLRNYLTPAEQISYTKQMLRSLNTKMKIDKRDHNQRVKDWIYTVKTNGPSPELDMANADIISSMQKMKNKAGGFTAGEILQTEAAMTTEVGISKLKDAVALLSPDKRAKATQEVSEDINKFLKLYFQGDSEISKKLNEPESLGEINFKANQEIGRINNALQTEFRKSPRNYIDKYNTSLARDLNKAQNPKQVQDVIDKATLQAESLGAVRGTVEWFPSRTTEPVGAAINTAQDHKDADSLITIFNELRGKYNDTQVSRLLDEAIERGDIKDKVIMSALRHVAWLPTEDQQKNTLEDLIAIKENRTLYNTTKRGSDKRIVFDPEGDISRKIFQNYPGLSVGTHPNVIRRVRDIGNIVEARFYTLKGQDKTANENDGKIVDEALRQTLAGMYKTIKLGSSVVTIPKKSYKTSTEPEMEVNTKANIKALISEANKKKLDLTKMPNIVKQLGNPDPRVAQEVADKFARDNYVAASSQGDNNDGDLTIYIKTPSGTYPAFFQETGSLSVPLRDLEKNEKALEIIEKEENSSIFKDFLQLLTPAGTSTNDKL